MLYVDSPVAVLHFLANHEHDAPAELSEFLVNASERMEGFRVVDGVFSRIPQTIVVRKRAITASLFFTDFSQGSISLICRRSGASGANHAQGAVHSSHSRRRRD